MDYYEMSIICEGSSDGGQEFFGFHDDIKIFCSANDAREWLKNQYSNCDKIKRKQIYHGNGIPCGYIFEYENADWSHSPVEKWIQRDWITVEKCHSDNAFKEIEYEIPENKDQ